MPRAADPSVGLHQLPLSKAKPLSGLEKGLSLIVSGVGGGRDARRKERQERRERCGREKRTVGEAREHHEEGERGQDFRMIQSLGLECTPVMLLTVRGCPGHG